MMMAIQMLVVLLVPFCKGKIFESNPFFNGQIKPPNTIQINSELINNTLQVKPLLPLPAAELFKYCLAPRGQFPSIYCNKFVDCWEGNAVEFFCPQTLLFNPKGYCDYPQNVFCNGKPIQSIDPVSSSAPIGWPSDGSYRPPVSTGSPLPAPSGWPSDGSYRPPSSTGGGWPSDGSYKPPALPADSSFKPPAIGGILYPTLKPSSTSTSSTTPPSSDKPTSTTAQPTTNPHLHKLCLRARGQFQGTTCGKYVNCWDNVVMEQDCPETLHFNAAKGYCDYAANSNCHEKPDTGSHQSTTLKPPHLSTSHPVHSNLSKYCLKARGQFPSSRCNKYVNCWDGYVIEQDCPEDLVFHAQKGYCDYKQTDHDCTRKEAKMAFVDSKIETHCPLPQGTFRDTDNCLNYYTCIDKKIVAQYECPHGYLFNDIIGVCDLKERVNCTNERFIHYPMITNIVPAAVIDPALPCMNGTIFKLNQDCSQVAICRNGLTEIIQCPSGLKYDINSDKCLESIFAEC